MHNNNNYQCKMYWNKAQTFDVDAIKFSFRTIVFTQYMQDVFILHFSKLTLRVCTLVLFILHMHNYIYIYIYIYIIESVDSIYIKNIFLNEQKTRDAAAKKDRYKRSRDK